MCSYTQVALATCSLDALSFSSDDLCILNKTKELIFCMDPKTQKERDEVVKRKYIYKPVFIIFGILNILIIALFVISL